MKKWHVILFLLAAISFEMSGQDPLSHLQQLPSEKKLTSVVKTDWLIDPSPYIANVFRGENNQLVLSNGLVERRFLIVPNAATIALNNLYSGTTFLRAVRPEGIICVNGINYNIGGLRGQPNHAFLKEEWIRELKNDTLAMQFSGFEVKEITERFPWKRVRSHSPLVSWPPKGKRLRMDYIMPSVSIAGVLTGGAQESHLGRKLYISDDLITLEDHWKIHTSTSHARSSFSNEGKTGEIYTPMHSCVFAETLLPVGTRSIEATFNPGTDLSRQYGPGIAMVWDDKTIKLNLSPGGDGYNPFLTISYFDGKRWVRRFEGAGKFDSDISYTLRIRIQGEEVCLDIKPENGNWRNMRSLLFKGGPGEPVAARIGKMDESGGDRDARNVGELVRTTVKGFRAYGDLELEDIRENEAFLKQIRVSVYYEIYDGIPVIAKWIEVYNGGDTPITLNRFTSEILAAVEYTSRVEERGVHYPLPNIHVQTDYAFGGFDVETSSLHSVSWERDPEYKTQVMGVFTTPCLLKVGPKVGPEQDIAPGETFRSFTAFILPFDSDERERKGLSVRKMYRTIAPWVTENPLMMHIIHSDWESVKNAIDQCAEVGFEMLIMSFGSRFNIEDDSEEYINKMKEYAKYAREKGIELGGYSLLSSRSAKPSSDNVVSPPGQKPTHGVMPALASQWGQEYMNKLRNFFEKTGQSVLEHDGSYPGDFDMKPRPPLQKGGADSQWVQWEIISDYYKWCKEHGIYLNIPDFYFLVGGNKIGMGYREVNWSLPREEQLIHTRQNIYDGTWEKIPSMGWMFVPLTVYHGGGKAATIEPLCEHLDHYRNMMAANMGAGVQCLYRGKRLYDTEETKQMVKGMVDWYKSHREVLESDIIHLCRADGMNPDYYLHANPSGKEKGLLMIFNPVNKDIKKKLLIPLYYTGLNGKIKMAVNDGKSRTIKTDCKGNVEVEVNIPAGGFSYVVFTE